MYAVDHLPDATVTWALTDDGAVATEHPGYTPTFFVGDPVAALYGPADPPPRDGLSDALATLRADLAADRRVVDTAVEPHRQTWRTDARPLLRVDVEHVEHVRPLARVVHERGRPGRYTCYDVDLSPAFRFCLETDTDPTPARRPRTLALRQPRHELDARSLPQLTCEGDRLASSPPAVLEALDARLAAADPDVLVVNTARLVPLLMRAADDYGVDLQLGRRPGWRQLAGESTYTSYGRVGHSPARYDVPGRVVVDRSNTFFYDETTLEGCLDLVARSRKPLQELSWASIGNVLTAMQIREARSRDVLVPWRPWRPEFAKPAGTLDDADRGGFTFAPETGVHEGVHELDFSSLYPNVIVTRNVSPETVRCGCCDNDAVPGLDYAICERDGYLPDVLAPVVADRDAIKAELRAIDDGTDTTDPTDGRAPGGATAPGDASDADGPDDPERAAALTGRSSALKWLLVSCFGYQGFSNAKFGRIECHEAINAFAREILLDAKGTLEAGGWRVVHGIVDGLWVTARSDCEQEPLDELAAAITEDVGIELEHEAAYDWIAFPPLRGSDAGALTRYFGRRRDGSTKVRGIECRQRSTPPFVADVQRELIATFGETRSAAAVCARLAAAIRRLRRGDVDPERLVERARVSQPVDAYDHYTRTVAALERARTADGGGRGRVRPGQDVAFVVVNDDAATADRVALAHEVRDAGGTGDGGGGSGGGGGTGGGANEDGGTTRYDVAYYRDELVRAAASVLGPVGWDGDDVADWLADGTPVSLAAFGSGRSGSGR